MVLELRLVVAGELGTLLGVQRLRPGQERLRLLQGGRPARIVGQQVIEVVIGKEIVVAVGGVQAHRQLERSAHV